MHRSTVMDPNNPRWMTSEQRRARSARMWKIVVSALSGAALATMVVASCLDRDEDAKLDEPGITQTTSADLPPGGVNNGASSTDTSSGIGGASAGVPADQGITDANPTTEENTTPAPSTPSTTDSSAGAPMSRAPVTIENVENMSVNVTNMSTVQPAPTSDSPNASLVAPIAGHASHQDNDPNALVQRGLTNQAAGVPTATSDDASVSPTYWTPAGPYILQGVSTAGSPTVPAPVPAAPTVQTPDVRGGAPMRGGAPVTGGAPPSAPSPTTPMVQPMR